MDGGAAHGAEALTLDEDLCWEGRGGEEGGYEGVGVGGVG